jgi:hypothetical protein
MNTKQKYTHKLLLALIDSDKSLQEKTLSALYELGTDGDYTSTENKKVDAVLKKLANDEEMPDIIGEIHDSLKKKIKTHMSKN